MNAKTNTAEAATATLFAWFNTGRAYTENGQEIMFRIADDGSAVFIDIDRGIQGRLFARLDRVDLMGSPRSIDELADDVLRAYDAHAYGAPNAARISELWDWWRARRDDGTYADHKARAL